MSDNYSYNKVCESACYGLPPFSGHFFTLEIFKDEALYSWETNI